MFNKYIYSLTRGFDHFYSVWTGFVLSIRDHMKIICTAKNTYTIHRVSEGYSIFSTVPERNMIVVDFIENGRENFRAFEVMTEYVFLPLGYLTKTVYAHSVFY